MDFYAAANYGDGIFHFLETLVYSHNRTYKSATHYCSKTNK